MTERNSCDMEMSSWEAAWIVDEAMKKISKVPYLESGPKSSGDKLHWSIRFADDKPEVLEAVKRRISEMITEGFGDPFARMKSSHTVEIMFVKIVTPENQ